MFDCCPYSYASAACSPSYYLLTRCNIYLCSVPLHSPLQQAHAASSILPITRCCATFSTLYTALGSLPRVRSFRSACPQAIFSSYLRALVYRCNYCYRVRMGLFKSAVAGRTWATWYLVAVVCRMLPSYGTGQRTTPLTFWTFLLFRAGVYLRDLVWRR